MDNQDILAIVCVTFFRVAVVVAGAVSIVCGYRLFLTGSEVSPHETNFKLESPTVKFLLRSAAPGVFFALFGAGLIVSMIVRDMPEYFREGRTEKSPDGAVSEQERTLFRGGGELAAKLLEEAQAAEMRGDNFRAINSYEQLIRQFSEPMNNLAWLYLNVERVEEAENLSRVAVQFEPKNQNFRHTLNEVESKKKTR